MVGGGEGAEVRGANKQRQTTNDCDNQRELTANDRRLNDTDRRTLQTEGRG